LGSGFGTSCKSPPRIVKRMSSVLSPAASSKLVQTLFLECGR
jgi:hypothetical protein